MIDHLLVLAAPGGAGKSEFGKRLVRGQLLAIEARLGIDNFNQWQVVSRRTFAAPGRLELSGCVIFECNIQSPYCNGLAYDCDKRIAQVMRQAREISVVTLWTPPDRLRRQRVKRELSEIQKLGLLHYGLRRALITLFLHSTQRFDPVAVLTSFGTSSWTLQRLLEYLPGLFINRFWAFYLRPSEVVRCYDRWLQFCAGFSTTTRRTCIVEFEKSVKFYSREEWQNMVRRFIRC